MADTQKVVPPAEFEAYRAELAAQGLPTKTIDRKLRQLVRYYLSSTEHARARAKERHGLDLTPHEVVGMGRRINRFLKEKRTIAADKDVMLLRRDLCFPETATVMIKNGEGWLTVVYSPVEEVVRTIMPAARLPFRT